MRGITNKVTEDINKKLDSPKDVPYKEKEEAISQRLSSAMFRKQLRKGNLINLNIKRSLLL